MFLSKITRSKSTNGRSVLTSQAKSYELLSYVSKKEKMNLEKKFPGLSNRNLFKETDHNATLKAYRVLLGKGTFSQIALSRETNNENNFYALRKIKSNKNFPNEFSRSSSIESTKREIQLHQKLKELKLADYFALAKESIELPNKKQEDQIYQMLPIADFGNGSDLINQLTLCEFNRDEKNKLFYYLANNLLRSVSLANDHLFFIRDIKPDNILLTSQGELFLSDLGSAAYYPNNQAPLIASDLSDRTYIPPRMLYQIFNPNKKIFFDSQKDTMMDAWALSLSLLEFWAAIYQSSGMEILLENIFQLSLGFQNQFKQASFEIISFSYLEIVGAMKKLFDQFYSKQWDPILNLVYDLMRANLFESHSVSELIQKYEKQLPEARYPKEFISDVFKKILNCRLQTNAKLEPFAGTSVAYSNSFNTFSQSKDTASTIKDVGYVDSEVSDSSHPFHPLMSRMI